MNYYNSLEIYAIYDVLYLINSLIKKKNMPIFIFFIFIFFNLLPKTNSSTPFPGSHFLLIGCISYWCKYLTFTRFKKKKKCWASIFICFRIFHISQNMSIVNIPVLFPLLNLSPIPSHHSRNLKKNVWILLHSLIINIIYMLSLKKRNKKKWWIYFFL